MALDSGHGWREGGKQVELALGALGGLGQHSKQRQCVGQVRAGFGIGTAAQGIVRRMLEIPERAVIVASPRKVYG